jgi:MFS family permease
LASRYAVGNERLQLRGIALAYGTLGILSVAIYLSPNMYVAFGLLTIYAVGQYSTAGPLLATIQTLVPERMRATAIALIYLCANLIGMGLGPLAVGVLSDAFQHLAGNASLRFSLLALSPGFLWVAWHLYRASVTVNEDIEAVYLGNSSVTGKLVAAIQS